MPRGVRMRLRGVSTYSSRGAAGPTPHPSPWAAPSPPHTYSSKGAARPNAPTAAANDPMGSSPGGGPVAPGAWYAVVWWWWVWVWVGRARGDVVREAVM